MITWLIVFEGGVLVLETEMQKAQEFKYSREMLDSRGNRTVNVMPFPSCNV